MSSVLLQTRFFMRSKGAVPQSEIQTIRDALEAGRMPKVVYRLFDVPQKIGRGARGEWDASQKSRNFHQKCEMAPTETKNNNHAHTPPPVHMYYSRPNCSHLVESGDIILMREQSH